VSACSLCTSHSAFFALYSRNETNSAQDERTSNRGLGLRSGEISSVAFPFPVSILHDPKLATRIARGLGLLLLLRISKELKVMQSGYLHPRKTSTAIVVPTSPTEVMRAAFRMLSLVLLVELAIGRNIGKEDSNRRLVRKRMRVLLEKLLQLVQIRSGFLVLCALRFLRLRKRIRLVVERALEIRGLAGEIHELLVDIVPNSRKLPQVFLAQHSQLSIGQIVSEDPRLLGIVQRDLQMSIAGDADSTHTLFFFFPGSITRTRRLLSSSNSLYNRWNFLRDHSPLQTLQ
jgi:hypothetical protein